MGLLIVAVIALAHLALLIAFIQRGSNALFLVGAAFVVFAPLSLGSDLPQLDLVKYLRVYTSCLLFGLGFLFFFYNHRRFGACSWLVLVFCAFWTLASFWSSSPHFALMYKGLFSLVVVGGILLAYAPRTADEIQSGVRWLVLGGLLLTILITIEWARTPGAVSQFGRLSTFGMNPNTVGHATAPILILSMYLALYGQRSRVKMLAYGLIPLAIILLLASGSRGSVGMAMIGCFLLALPKVRNPGALAVATVVVAAALFGFFRLLDTGGAERLTEVDFANRFGVWRDGVELFAEQPIIGHGWVASPGRITAESTRNLHSAYIQVLAETGVPGFLYFLTAMIFVSLRGLRLTMGLSRDPAARSVAILGSAILLSVLAHMVIESGSLAGTTINAMTFGFAIGLIDRAGEAVSVPAATARAVARQPVAALAGRYYFPKA